MATTVTVSAKQIFTGEPYDTSIINYAPTLNLLLTSHYAPDAVIFNALVNSKTGPVYEQWSSPTPFDPNASPFNLSYYSTAGSTLNVSQALNSWTMAFVNGSKTANFKGSFQTSGDNIWDADGKYIPGICYGTRNNEFNDTNGTASYLDDTYAYENISNSIKITIDKSITYSEFKETAAFNCWSDGYYLDVKSSFVKENTISGSGQSAVFTPHKITTNLSGFSYWSSDFRLSLSGNLITDYDKNIDQINLNNVSIIDNILGSKTTSLSVSINTSYSINPNIDISEIHNINIGILPYDNLPLVKDGFTKNILPFVLDSGVEVTAINYQGSKLQGGGKDDKITGGEGADTAIGGGGNDTIDGDLGVNTAVYSGKFADYVIKAAGNGAYTISDSVSGRDGTDTLTNIQNLQFFDVTKAIADIINSGGGTPATPTLTVSASVNLSANQSINVGNWFTPQTTKSGAAIDLWIFYETGSGVGASNGHVHVNNGYILQNNVWSVFSGDVPAQTLVAVTGVDFSQTTYSAPKVVGMHDELYAGFLSDGQWSNTAHTTIIT